MSKNKPKKDNLRLAAIFVVFVIGLVTLSFIVKIFFLFKDSKFDGNHKFNVLIHGSESSEIVSFSPNPRSISVLSSEDKKFNLEKELEVPIDGKISTEVDISERDISSILISSLFNLKEVKKLTLVDVIRLSIFARSVPKGSFYERSIFRDLNQAQKNTLISLTFVDPDIYKENQTIEIINSSGANGLGSKFATFIENLGGNVILVTSGEEQKNSKISYIGEKSYTVNKLGSYFDIQLEKNEQKQIADVIIVLGKDISERGL